MERLLLGKPCCFQAFFHLQASTQNDMNSVDVSMFLVPHGLLPCGYQDTLTSKNWMLLKLGSTMEQLQLAARSYPQGEVQVSFEHIMSHACRQSPGFLRQMQGWGNATCTRWQTCIPIWLIEETQKREEHYRLSSCAVCVVSTTHYIVKSFTDSQTRLFGFSCKNNDRNTGSFEKSVELAPDKVKDVWHEWLNK